MRWYDNIQGILLGAVVTLLCLGLVMIYSSSAVVAQNVFHSQLFFFLRHSFYVAAGIGVIFAATLVPIENYRRYAYPLYFAAVFALILVLIPGIGTVAGGSRRWIPIGPVHFQAGEVFKFAVICYLSMSLAKKGPKMHLFRVGIIPHLVLPGVAMALLMLEPDFGTAFIVAAVTFIMLFLGGARMSYLFGGIFAAIPILWHLISSSPYRLQRLIAFLDPWAHRQDIGYQVVESLISMGSGGLWGLGLGQGNAKLFYLPAAHTDFILAVIGEELGFLGVCLVLLCFFALIYCGFRICIGSKNPFHVYMAAGITTMLSFQAILNTFVVMGLAPTKGVTLPFVSYGGSSLLMSCLMAGILLRLSEEQEKS